MDSINCRKTKKKTSFRDIVVGIYIYNKDAIKIAKKLKPSKRKELEITELNNILIKKKKLKLLELITKKFLV